ncbi:sorting nexin-21 isoform X3 [Aquila chrysaetos chrysaetos]|uniref:sorting nexin-21 isoform X3 n=1 Tax=Aquila chrysaetos chrysaetos TaxID=223781 RepID=UPI00117663BE|nr:sorting nexin-21 isoform X3 [Aquila chrysaetos chrysaetos]
MAARILHRLRHALAGEGGREERACGGSEAEDCPESSELEDDTEGLSTRLSGTLSFTSHEEEEEEEEEDGAGDELGEPPQPTGTAAGAEDGGRVGPRGGAPRRQPADPAAAGAVEEIAGQPGAPAAALRGHQRQRGQRALLQLYTIYLIRSGRFDKAPAAIARRYSDFERLNRRLRCRFGCDMAGIAFPRKRLRRNFTAETIAKRSRAFEQFLSHLHSIAEIRRSPEFLEFFFLQDLQAAQRLTCTGMYREALATWANAYRLQDRLGVCGSGRFLLTLAGLAVCHQELDELGEAHGFCEQALQLLEAQGSHPLLGPFLQAHVHLAWKVGKDKRRSEARLQDLREAGPPLQQQPTLKECLIKEPLE